MNEFSTLIQARKDKKLTQLQAAKLFNQQFGGQRKKISRAKYARWEQSDISYNDLTLLCSLFDIAVLLIPTLYLKANVCVKD